MKQETLKRNIIFILIIGIEGLAFGLLDWDSVISDLVYIQYNQKTLISLIAANIGVAKLVATLICIYINDSKKPNKIFIVCVILCAIGSVLIGITYNLGWLILFAIIYVLETLVLEIYSGYHYAYVYNSLPDEIATEVHSKRISIFKITFMIVIGIASFLTTKFMNNTMIIVTISSAIVLLALILPISKVKNCSKNKEEISVPLKQKLNLRNYTKYYKSWVITRFLGKFALSSLVVLLSMIVIDSNMDLATLKTFKTGAWFLSSIGFWISAYLIKNKIIVKGDILCKSTIAILVIISFFCPYAIYAILLLNGLLNPFNTMSNFTMIQMDKDNISVAQKELLINLFGYFSGMLSSYILLNINVHFALILIVITLTFSVMNEIRLYKMNQS
jgi:MFS family permease